MAWDLATAKTVTGTTGTTSDAALTLVMDVTLSAIEKLLARGLLYKEETIAFYFTDNHILRVPRYPIDTVISVTGTCPVSVCKVHHRVGWIRFKNWAYGDITVRYRGGFKELPPALERAMWEAFLFLWGKSDSTTGAPLPNVSTGGTVIQGGGEVDRISLADFGSVSFNYGSSYTPSDDSADQQAVWGWLAPWASILQIYRSEAAPSVAFA